jgi:hypothetical protein
MSQIIYSSGVLSPASISAVKYGIDRDYVHWVEFDKYPEGFTYEWQKANLVLYDRQCEDCMGNSYSDKTHKFIICRPFIGFISEKEKSAFIRDFSNDIKNQNPFAMSF